MNLDSATASSRLPAQLRDLIHQPNRLGLVLNVALLGAWYLVTYSPLHRAISQDDHRLSIGRQRLALAHEVEHLRTQADRYGALLPASGDGDIWIPFLMAGIREFPTIKLVSLEPRPPVKVGPYSAPVHRIVVEGSYFDLEQLLRWLEEAPRLIRIDSIQIAPRNTSAGPRSLIVNEMHLLVMGIEGSHSHVK